MPGSCANNWSDYECSGHRWYLFLVLWVHICIALSQRLGIPGWLQVIVHSTLALHKHQDNGRWFDPCQRDIPNWLKWILSLILPWGTAYSTSTEVVAQCPIMHDWLQFYVLLCVVFFYYSRPCMKMVTGTISRLGMNTTVWAVVAGCLSLVIGATNAAFNYPSHLFEPAEGSKFTLLGIGAIILELGVTISQPTLFALAMTRCPFDLSWWGGTTLGTYIFHFYFGDLCRRIIGFGLKLLQPVQGLGFPQLLFLLSCPIAFMTTLGPLFHNLLLSPRVIAGWLDKVLYARHAHRLQKGTLTN